MFDVGARLHVGNVGGDAQLLAVLLGRFDGFKMREFCGVQFRQRRGFFLLGCNVEGFLRIAHVGCRRAGRHVLTAGFDGGEFAGKGDFALLVLELPLRGFARGRFLVLQRADLAGVIFFGMLGLLGVKRPALFGEVGFDLRQVGGVPANGEREARDVGNPLFLRGDRCQRDVAFLRRLGFFGLTVIFHFYKAPQITLGKDIEKARAHVFEKLAAELQMLLSFALSPGAGELHFLGNDADFLQMLFEGIHR